MSNPKGVDWAVGGVAWERFPVDPHPGPRPLADVRGAEPVGAGAALIHPETGATTPEERHFCESRLAGFLGTETVLIDVTEGRAAPRQESPRPPRDWTAISCSWSTSAATRSPPATSQGLASPLCDAVMIAAAARRGPQLPCVLGVLGAGCDGELRPAEVLGRVAALARAGAWLTTTGVPPPPPTRSRPPAARP